MSEDARRIVIRRPRKSDHGFHGGSWKIALADFMTAMMALFLVLWLLATATPQQLSSVAEYFRTPLSVALASGDRQSASNNVIPGGGTDPTHSEGEQQRTETRMHSRMSDIQRRFTDLQRRIERAVMADPALRDLRDQMRFETTPLGLRIQLLDSERRPMFELGSDRVAPYMRDLLHTLAPLLNEVPGSLSITGHTDSLPYRAGEAGYSNWELSADRANASRRELVAAGFEAGKLSRVTGLGDRSPVPGSEPGDAINRRITLVVMSEEAARALQQQLDAVQHGPGLLPTQQGILESHGYQ